MQGFFSQFESGVMLGFQVFRRNTLTRKAIPVMTLEMQSMDVVYVLILCCFGCNNLGIVQVDIMLGLWQFYFKNLGEKKLSNKIKSDFFVAPFVFQL